MKMYGKSTVGRFAVETLRAEGQLREGVKSALDSCMLFTLRSRSH